MTKRTSWPIRVDAGTKAGGTARVPVNWNAKTLAPYLVRMDSGELELNVGGDE